MENDTFDPIKSQHILRHQKLLRRKVSKFELKMCQSRIMQFGNWSNFGTFYEKLTASCNLQEAQNYSKCQGFDRILKKALKIEFIKRSFWFFPDVVSNVSMVSRFQIHFSALIVLTPTWEKVHSRKSPIREIKNLIFITQRKFK